MRKIVILIALSLSIGKGYAQSDTTSKHLPKLTLICYRRIPPIQGFILVNDRPIQQDYLTHLDAEQIDSVQVINASAAVGYAALYGSAAANGLLKVTMKKNIHWVSLEVLFKQYKINANDRKLPVFFKDVEIQTNAILINRNHKLIFKVETNSPKKLKNLSSIDKYLTITEK